jgi:homospermidine synthase
VLEHGANPGLISHWTKRGLLDIAAAVLAEKKAKGAKAEESLNWRTRCSTSWRWSWA